MDCAAFLKWLENRDIYDVSEAEKAIRHSAGCAECRAKLQVDEKLDTLIFTAMQKEGLPAGLQDRIDLNLGPMSTGTSKLRYGFYGIFSAAAALAAFFFLAFLFLPGAPSLETMADHVVADHTGHGDSILVVHNPDNLGRLGPVPVGYREIARQLPAGMQFVGARICALGDCKAVHIVLHQGGKRVSLYLIPEQDVAFSASSGHPTMSRGAFTVEFWKHGPLVYAMVG